MKRNPNLGPSGERVLHPPSSEHTWEWPLWPWWRSVLLLLPVIALGAGLCWKVMRVQRSAFLVDTVSAADIHKGLERDPGNADLIHRLGVVCSYNDPSNINLTEAVKYLRQAVSLNPRRWNYWADLGSACDFVGDTKCSDEAFEQARELNPLAPVLEWTLGNHYLVTSREEKAFPYFRRLLETDPNYLDPTFRLCLRAVRDPMLVYKNVLPTGKDATARFAFLLFLNSTADYEDAMRIWGLMIAGPDRSPNLLVVKPFLDFLIDHNQIQDGERVWLDLEHAGVVPTGGSSPKDNLIYDGGFEWPPLNSGFAWRTSDSPDLVIDFDRDAPHQGTRSLRVDFAVGRNAGYDVVNQVVPIQPNQRYQLTAYVRSDSITSDSGPRLLVTEVGCANCETWTSDAVQGTTSWHPLETEFVTHPQTEAVRISLWRPQDRTSSRDITGSVWLDDVTLRSVEPPKGDLTQKRSR